MAYRGKPQDGVNKRTQTASERTSMTITMPPPPENFPQFSQNEANGMQSDENAVSGHLAKTPTQEFANFNKQVNANGSEVDKSPKPLSATGNGNRRDMETKSSTHTHGHKSKTRPFIRKKNGIKRKRGRNFQRYHHCSTKDVDNDNIETDDENGDKYKYKHRGGGEYGDENGDDDEPIISLYQRMLLSFRRENEKFYKSEALEFHKSNASGNILGAESNSRDPAATSHLNDMNGNNPRESERLSEGPQKIHNGAIIPDPNFNTEVLFSKERAPPKIIQLEPVDRNIAIIHKMIKESPEEPKMSTWKLIRHRVSSWTGRLNPLRRWSQSGRDNEARMSLRHSEADLGAFTRDELRENAERKIANGHTRDSAHSIKRAGSSGQNSEESFSNVDVYGIREVEAEVIRMSSPARTCLISRSKSVRSVEPIIEDASNETGGGNAAQENAQRLQTTQEPIDSDPDPEGTTLRRRPRVERLRREFTGSIEEVINSNRMLQAMSNVDTQGSSASSEYLETIATRNLLGYSYGLNQSQQNLTLMSGVADDSIQDDDDFGAPLCRYSSRELSAEEESQEHDILEDKTSTVTAIKEKCRSKVDRSAVRGFVPEGDPIPESALEDSEASQRSNSDPPSLTNTTNTSESSMSVQQQYSCGIFRSNAIRRKRRSMSFESYNDALM
ncbi:hypothetical protein BELL_0347g00130 [Botrytis elliptica]|uniref:Uncharacterized protein n=1 Tax=Botrytis elliptica TaxID=278938 RepID=A0A4Z1JIV0_9HELO|nr:hypothetical protein EAE99_011462 [Botrytis elliptica]TGO73611.1 hypothetical protein BELL_0347g00130 [Botrytis elliptica]